MKKTLAVIMAVALIVCAFPFGSAFAAGSDAVKAESKETSSTQITVRPLSMNIHEDVTIGSTGDCSFELSDGILTISGNGNMGDYSSTPAPWGKDITQVIIGNGVKGIGKNSFYGCSELTSITMGSGVENIGEEAFYGCIGLTRVNISDLSAWCKISFAGIDSNPLGHAKHLYLNGSEITDLVIPDDITSIGKFAFSGCSGLTSLAMGNDVTGIGEAAFNYCTGIASVTIGKNVTNIGKEAFYGCTALETVYYRSTETDWAKINIGDNNTVLTSATRYYNYYCDISGHSYKNVWSTDNSQHWHECSVCGDKTDVAAHIYDGVNDATCNICEYVRTVEYKKFPDVQSNAWYYDAVNFCTMKGYISGYGTGYFGPDDNIQRQDFVLILARIDGVDLSKYEGKSKFSDIPSGQYYTAAVNWASENGIVSGYTNGKFGLGDSITREQLVLILFRYAESKYGKQSYNSAKAKAMGDYNTVSDWASTAIEWAIDTGVISGMDGGTRIAPLATATRCQIAQILYNINKNNILPF